MKRIKILGAGISGVSAALTLARAGYEVEIYEKNKRAEDRYLGDLQGIENWTEKTDTMDRLAEMGIALNFDCAPFSELTVMDGQQVAEKFRFNRPFFYLVKRGAVEGSLDRGLREQAMAAGVTIHFERTIPAQEADIAATGPISKEIFIIDKAIVFRTTSKDIAVGLVNNKAAARGYSYLLITNGYGCISSILFDRFGDIHDCFAETKRLLLNKFEVDIQSPQNVGGVGSFSTQQRLKLNGKTLLAGEAAGIQDLLWGFGIKNALMSGHLAARSIIQDEDYEKVATGYFGGKMKASIVNRFLWELLGRESYAFLIARTKHRKDPLRFLYLTHKFTLLHRLLYPVAVHHMRKRYPHLRL